MFCPFCGAEETKVIDSRLVNEVNQIRRRRECLECHERFTTYETAALTLPRIIKRDGSREPFADSKLLSGLQKALEKRPVSIEQLDDMLDRVKRALRNTGEREINSQRLGEIVMNELKDIDHVAYVRFASVYLSFEDINAFKQAIEHLVSE